MRKTIKIIYLLSLSFLLISCSNSNEIPSNEPKSEVIEYKGIVAIKVKDNSFQILVTKNRTVEEVRNKTDEELLELAKADNDGDYGGIWFYVNEEVYNEVIKGTKVKVSFKGPIQESLPPKATAIVVNIEK